jgi:hypothetical protein
MKERKEKKVPKIELDVKQLLQLIIELLSLLFKRFKWAMALSTLISYVVLRYDDIIYLFSLIRSIFK